MSANMGGEGDVMPFSVPLAFGFTSPFLLWGLLLAGVPFLIQWLHRRKYTERVWGAMRFLKAATESQTRRLRMESLLLLCVRTMILLLAALALAEPVLNSAGWDRPSGAATHTLIVLDNSLSMRADFHGVALGERAKEAARTLVRSGDPGDSYQLLTIEAQPQAVIRQPAYSAADVLAEIDRTVISESLGDVSEAIVRAERMLNGVPSGSRQRVVIISDFQRANWQLEEPAAHERTRQALANVARTAKVSLIPVGRKDLENAAVHHAHVDSPVVPAGASTTIMAQVRNFGAAPLRQRRVQLLEDGRVLETKTVNVAPHAETTVSFLMHWSEPGPHALQLRLEDDALIPDNDRWMSLDVREKLSVLLVNGRAQQENLQGATDFVELALRPALTSEREYTAAMSPAWIIEPTVVSEADLVRTDLNQFDCIFVCDVPFLSDHELTRLESFVRSGGGLVIGCGDQVQLDAYSRQLGAGGTGLMPVQFVQVVGVESPDAAPFHFAEPATGHPLTDPFAGNPDSGLTTANVYRYVDVRIPDDSAVRTPLLYAHGAPAIIEHRFGSGRVLLVTTSLDDRWGAWALWPSFLPMMHELVEYSISGTVAPTLLVGEPLSLPLPDGIGLGVSAGLIRPDGRRSTLNPSQAGQSAVVTVENTSQSGIYQMILPAPLSKTRLFPVNVDTGESDLRAMDETDLKASVLGSIGFEQADVSAASRTPSGRPTGNSTISGWLLLMVLALLLVEQLMAWNARAGLAALLVSPVLIPSFAFLPSATLVLLTVAAAALSMWRWKLRRLSGIS